MFNTTLLQNGEVWTYAMSPYTSVMGNWSYAIIMGIFISMVYLKTQSFYIPSILAVIGVAAFATFLPASLMAYLAVLMALAASAILLNVFKS